MEEQYPAMCEIVRKRSPNTNKQKGKRWRFAKLQDRSRKPGYSRRGIRSGSTPRPVACCNWPDGYPYAPEVRFRMFHTGSRLLLRFDVAENYTAARVTEDNGEVWTDSCVEFFLGRGRRDGLLQLRDHLYRTDAARIPTHTRRGRARCAGGDGFGQALTTLPFGEAFEEREGDNRWSVTLVIPPEALFRHKITDWSGVEARINLYKCGDNLSHPHFLSWRPIQTDKPDFHRPEYFGAGDLREIKRKGAGREPVAVEEAGQEP